MAVLSTIELPRLTVKVTGPLHIGTGFARGLINRTVTKGRDGLVYVPGSVIKGKARAACEALARLYGLADCRAPHPHRMLTGEPCLICQIFGAPGTGSRLHWNMAHLTPAWKNALKPPKQGAVFGQTTNRTQVQLSRKRGIALEARLYTSELVTESLEFEARPAITGQLKLTPVTLADETDVYYELILLFAGLKLTQALGGGASRGGGECEFLVETDNVTIDGRTVPVLRQLQNADLLEFYKEEMGS